MRWIDILRIAIHMSIAHKLRTLLTVFGIGLAVGLIVILTGLGHGIQDLTIGSIIRSKSLLSLEISTESSSGQKLTDESIARIKKMGNISEISPVMTTEGQIRFQDKLTSNTIQAVDENFFAIEGVNLALGRLFEKDAHEVVVSPQVLSLLEIDPTSILESDVIIRFENPDDQNELITLDKPFKVVGITDGRDSSAMFIPFSIIKPLPKTHMTSIKVVVSDRDSVATLQDKLKDQGYLVESLLETLDSARQVFQWVTIGLVVIALIALVVAAIGMFNTLTITLLERTRDIGIMKAIGVGEGAIQRLFLTEATMIGFIGGITGIVLGFATGASLNAIFNQIALHYGGSKVALFSYPPDFVISMVLFPAILGIVTGLYPAIRAAHFNPLDALRYE